MDDDKPLSVKPADVALNAFLKIYGSIYEHSPWIAEGAYKSGAATVRDMHSTMKKTVAAGTDEQKFALIRAHPDLAPAIGTDLTTASVSEQKGAGLKECTADEYAEFQQLNRDYKAKFGFPFIVAVKGLHRTDILQLFRQRMKNDAATEFATALAQIDRIAYFRLMALP
ncbi:MAG: 2-oxo-4-hydroxy-4-carboxy-5-ureidoimidazoline decarboxylase [bacterium]|nr:2-oxo-4-hydroxy-4-carboxy-5-ureidoimidazoline decarboxylase [bacterium]